MSKEKQIEEMERIIDEKGEFIISDSYDAFIKVKMACKTAAERLYNADYRKQSEGEWIKHDSMPLSRQCGNCKGWYTKHSILQHDYNFCPNCGAKMKGGGE